MPEELIFKTYEAETKVVEDKGRRVLNVTITTNTVDRDGDIVEPKGISLTNFRKNPVVLMAHDYRGLPIARAENLKKTDTGITSDVVFPDEGVYPLADTVYRLYKDKFMRAWSIGFIPIKIEDIIDEDEKGKDSDILRRQGKWIKKSELLEYSGCTVPTNAEALTNMIAKGINVDTLKEAGFIEIEDKGVIPFKETPKAPEGEAWDAGREIRQAEIGDLKIMCTWFDSENPDIKGAYKLPHHKAKGHAVVWRGVAAAMGALLGARGGVAVPAGDKKGIYGHLIKHYKQFDKEPPEFRDYDEAELKELFPEEDKLKEIGLFDVNELYDIVKENKELKLKVDELKKSIKELELKAGAVLNSKNKKDLKDAQTLIQSVLDSAEINEDSLEIEDEKDSKEDDSVIELEESKKDDEGIEEEEDKKTIEVDEKVINKVIDDQMGYLIGKVKQSDTKK